MDETNKELTEKVKNKKIGMSTDKKIIISIVAVMLIIALGIFGFVFYNSNMKPVATYDGGSLSTADFTIYYKLFAPMLQQYGYDTKSIADQIAKKAASDKMLMIKAKAANVTYTAENKKTVDDLFSDQEQLKTFTSQGIDIDKLRQLYYDDYTINAYINKIKEELTEDEVLAYLKKQYGEDLSMKEYVTRHILFKTVDESNNAVSDEEKATIKANALAVLARVKAGEDFATLAKEFTEDAGTKEQGGEYKMYVEDGTVEAYRNGIGALSIGQIGDTLVETDYGYHIVKLEAINENGRINSSNDRLNLAYEKIDKQTAAMNLKVDNTVLYSVVETITGVKIYDESATK